MLAIGLWLIFYYCQGSIGAAAGDAISAFSIKVDMTTVGYPVIFGLPSLLLGSLLLIIGLIATLVAEVRGAFLRKRELVERPEAVAIEEQRPPV